jgi:hypothetical protein
VPSYNPLSDKRRGDAFDLDLLYYIPLPAIIVTGDKRFARGLKQTDAPHGRQVLTIEEFNRHLAENSLVSLVSDVQTAEGQLRQHQEAAFFRWHEWGNPTNDDWADWFASEPIA